MYNIPLKEVTARHICGCWTVKKQQAMSVSADFAFYNLSQLEFDQDHNFSINGELKGTYRLIKVSDIIFSPQIMFAINGEEYKAILTRLVSELYDDEQMTMSLYFSNGLQLTCDKEQMLRE